MVAVLHPDLEDGETDPVLVKYKPEKLVSFPGFNDPMPHRTREVCNLVYYIHYTQVLSFHQIDLYENYDTSKFSNNDYYSLL